MFSYDAVMYWKCGHITKRPCASVYIVLYKGIWMEVGFHAFLMLAGNGSESSALLSSRFTLDWQFFSPGLFQDGDSNEI